MATYINYGEGETDAIVQGSEWLSGQLGATVSEDSQKKFLAKFKEVHTDMLESRDYDYGPIVELFIDYSKDLFSLACRVNAEGRTEEQGKSIESFYALVLSMVTLLEDPDQLDRITKRLCDILTASVEHFPEMRLRLLMNLYNTFPPKVEFRYRIFKCIVDFAHQANAFDQVMPYLEYLESWLVDWSPHLKAGEKRDLFRDLSRYVRALGAGKRADAFLHLKKYHQLHQGADADTLKSAEVKECTVQLLRDAVQIASVIQFDDILAFDTVVALSQTKDGAPLVDLCKVFLEGSLDDLRKHHKANGPLYKEHEICIEDATSKIRLLSLATLATGKSELSLDEVAKVLEEDPIHVEKWVVRAISECVIDGRIDQLNEKVLVKSTFQRKFAKDEWSFLDGKLSSWIENLESVVDFIGEQKKLKGAACADAAPGAAVAA